MPALNRDALLSMTTLRTVSVPIPELGPDAMILRELTGRDLVALQQRTGKGLDDLRGGVDFNGALDILAWLLRLSWIDDDGNLVMGDQDVDLIINMPVSAMMTLVNRVTDPLMQLNGLTQTAVEDAKKN